MVINNVVMKSIEWIMYLLVSDFGFGVSGIFKLVRH